MHSRAHVLRLTAAAMLGLVLSSTFDLLVIIELQAKPNVLTAAGLTADDER